MTVIKEFRLSVEDVEVFRKDIYVLLKQSFEKSFPTETFDDNEFVSRVDRLKEHLLSDKAIVYGVKLDDKLIGFVWFFVKDKGKSKVVHINHFAVHKEHRGRGLGSVLLQYVESYAKKSEVRDIELIVSKDNKDAIGFYTNRGFGVERYVMKKRLKRNV